MGIILAMSLVQSLVQSRTFLVFMVLESEVKDLEVVCDGRILGQWK